jgi:hypothetical protein
MACISAMISAIGLSVAGGAMGGAGFGNFAKVLSAPMSALGPIAGQMGAVSALANAASPFSSVIAMAAGGANPLQLVSGGASGVLGSLGSNIGFGAITGAIGDTFSAIGGSGIFDAISSHTSDLLGSFGANSMMQALQGAEGFSFMSGDIANMLSGTINAQFGDAFSALNSFLPAGEFLSGVDADFLAGLDPGEFANLIGQGSDFNFGDFLGGSINGIGDLVTNGLTNFISDQIEIPGFAGDLIKLGGSFNLNDIQNFGNPGQLIENLINAGAGEITGIVDAFGDIGFDIERNLGNLANGEFNDILNEGLGLITNPDMIKIAQQALGSNIPGISSLADFTNLAKVLPTSFDSITPDTFSQLAGELANTALGSLATPKQLGNLLNAFDLPGEFNLIDPLSLNLVDNDAVANLTAKFLGGTGVNGRIKVSDIIGSVAGVGLETPMNSYLAAMKSMENGGAFGTVNSLYDTLQNGLAGNLTVTGDPSNPIYGTDYINDTVNGLHHEDLDSFVKKIAGNIQGEVENIANNTTFAGAFGTASAAIQQVQKKIYDEQIVHLPRVDLHLEHRTNAPENVYSFVTGMANRVLDTDNVAMVKGLAKGATAVGDKFGEYAEAFTSEMINKNAVEQYQIDWMGENKAEIA